jgi:hypothetical protein
MPLVVVVVGWPVLHLLFPHQTERSATSSVETASVGAGEYQRRPRAAALMVRHGKGFMTREEPGCPEA